MSGKSTPSKNITKKQKSDLEPQRYEPLFAEPWLPRWGVAAILVAFAALIYLPNLPGEFIWDGEWEIAANDHLRDLSDPWKLMTQGFNMPPRPLPYLTFALNYALLGEDIHWFGVVNLLIHIANGFLIFGLIDKLARIQRESDLLVANARLFAATCATIWLIHPVGVHVISYVYQRQESLTALLMLLSIAFYVEYRVAPTRKSWLVGSLAACALAMTCKEIAVVMPILIILVDYFFFSELTPWRNLRQRWATFGLFFGTWSVLAAAMYFKKTTYPELINFPSPPFVYLLTQAKVILHYVSYTFLPDHVALTYVAPQVTSPLAVLPQLTILTVALGTSIWGVYHRKLAGLLGCWFFITLAPTSSVMPINLFIQDYRIYLACLSLICLASFALLWIAAFLSQPLGRLVFLAVFASAAGALSWQTASFARTYQSSIGIWQATLPYAADDILTLANLTKALNLAGRYNESIYYLSPYINAHNVDSRLATEYFVAMKKLGREKEALPIADKLAKRQELPATALFVIGNIYSDLKPTEAIESYQRTLELEPTSYQSLINIGVIYSRTDAQRSIEYLNRAIALNPNDPTAYLNLGVPLAQLNRLDEAIESYDKAIALDPDNATAIHNRQIMIQMRDKTGGQ